MSGTEKRQRVESCSYNPFWETEFFVSRFNDSCICLLCTHVFEAEQDVERHFKTYHNDYDIMFPKCSSARSMKIAALRLTVNQRRNSTISQQNFLSHSVGPFVGAPAAKKRKASNSTSIQKNVGKSSSLKRIREEKISSEIFSYRMAYMLAKAMKPLDDVPVIKELISEFIHYTCDGINDTVKSKLIEKLNKVSLCRYSMTNRLRAIRANISEQLNVDLRICNWFSLYLDKLTDVDNEVQLCVCVRMIFDNCKMKEELLSIIPLKDMTGNEDIHSGVKIMLENDVLPLHKLVAITIMDGNKPVINMIHRLHGMSSVEQLENCKAAESIGTYFRQPFAWNNIWETAATMLKLFPDLDGFIVSKEMTDITQDKDAFHTFNSMCKNNEPVENMWATIDRTKFGTLVDIFQRVLACFGSTYLRESVFSAMNRIKARFKSQMTVENLECLLSISTTSYVPEFQKLSNQRHLLQVSS